MKPTFYELLALNADASAEQIQHAYHEALQKLENDPHADNNAKTVLRDCYRCLSDPGRRAHYDASLQLNAQPQPVQRKQSPFEQETILPLLQKNSRRNQSRVIGLLIFIVVVASVSWFASNTGRSTSSDNANSTAIGSHSSSKEDIGQPADNDEKTNQTVKSASQIFQDNVASIALITIKDLMGKKLSSGSGVVIENGSVITNCHVVRNAPYIDVKIGDAHYNASIAVQDDPFDLCRLTVLGLQAPAVKISRQHALEIGQNTYAIGAPQGLEATISEGIISSLREIDDSEEKLIQTTASVSPGSSGGGLFNDQGELIGIVTFQFIRGQNLNFAVPVEWIAQMRSRVEYSEGRSDSGSDSSEATGIPTPQGKNKAILGQWYCFGAISGARVAIQFIAPRSYVAQIKDQKYSGYFYLSEEHLSVSWTRGLSGQVETLTESKLVIRSADSERLICTR